jgi:hypothetical protein
MRATSDDDRRGDHRGPDAVQAAGVVVVAVLELAAGVRVVRISSRAGFLCFGWTVDRNAAPLSVTVIVSPSLWSVHDDAVAVAVHRLVDRVVEQLPDEVMQAGAVEPADVHAGPLANRLQPFENSDVLGRVLLLRHANPRGSGRVADLAAFNRHILLCRRQARCHRSGGGSRRRGDEERR